MKLLDLIKPECIRAPLQATEKRGVIEELVDMLAQQGTISDPESLKAAVWSREQTKTTGIGAGLAIPHGKCSGLKEMYIAIGKPGTPLEFEALDNQPVRLVVLLASPPDRTSDHIQALASISRLIGQSEFRANVYAAQTAEAIYDLFAAGERAG